MTTIEAKFLALIEANPGIAASQLPRAKRGATLKSLELQNLIQFGPGGWYPVPKDDGGARLREIEREDWALHEEEKARKLRDGEY